MATTAPKLLRTRSDEIRGEEKTPTALRRSSDPTTSAEILDKQNICFKGGEKITFILTHRSRFTHGIHLGIKVMQDGKEFTLGFYPRIYGTGMFKTVQGAISIPDRQVEIALKTKTATIINKPDGEPFELSKEAAARLNEYTCNGTPGEDIAFELSSVDEGIGDTKTRASEGKQLVFTRKFVPKNLKYTLVSNFFSTVEGCTNCQGFLSTIFANDPDVIKTITPFLHEWGSKTVAKHKQTLRDAKPPSTYLDHFEKGTYLGLGGRKSHKKSRKPKKKHRKKTRKAGASSTQKERERNLQSSLQLALPAAVAEQEQQQQQQEQQDEQLREFEARLNELRQHVDTAETHWDDLQEWGPEADDTLEEQNQRLNDLMARFAVLQQHQQQNPHIGGRKRKPKKKHRKKTRKRKTKRKPKRKRRRTKRR